MGKDAEEGYDEIDLSEIGATDEDVRQVKEIVAKRRREREAKEKAAKAEKKAAKAKKKNEN